MKKTEFITTLFNSIPVFVFVSLTLVAMRIMEEVEEESLKIN